MFPPNAAPAGPRPSVTPTATEARSARPTITYVVVRAAWSEGGMLRGGAGDCGFVPYGPVAL